MVECLPILVVVPHADAGDRSVWTSDQDLRPLTDLGHTQAAMLAAILGGVDAIVRVAGDAPSNSICRCIAM